MNRIIAILVLFVISAQASFAQAPPPSGGSTVGAPIDDHVWLLSIVTILYGTYTMFQNRKQLMLKKA